MHLLRGLLGLTLTAVFTFQDQPPTIRVDVQMVTVDVEVFDGAGRPVTDLRSSDFLVVEDGNLQEIRSFSSAEQPYNLVFLFDCSQSTETHRPLINSALAQFSKYKRPADRVLIAAFGSVVQTVKDWTAPDVDSISFDLGAPRRGSTRPCSGTRLYNTLEWAARELRQVQTRKGIVILTDGVDSAPANVEEQGFQQALRTFGSSGIPIYFVAVGTDLNPTIGVAANPPEVRVRMERLAEASGGRAAFPKVPEDLVSIYERIGRELRTSYSLGYYPSNLAHDGRLRRIEVRLRSGGLQLRQSRESYVLR